MSSKGGGVTVCVALSMAAAVAVMSVWDQAEDMQPKLRWLLVTVAAPEAAATAGAVGESQPFAVPP
jgi:hypothetical protein